MLSAENSSYAESPAIKWNFTKFLVDQKGTVLARFEPTADFSKIEAAVKAQLQSEN
jgi:glutathione peroxidase